MTTFNYFVDQETVEYAQENSIRSLIYFVDDAIKQTAYQLGEFTCELVLPETRIMVNDALNPVIYKLMEVYRSRGFNYIINHKNGHIVMDWRKPVMFSSYTEVIHAPNIDTIPELGYHFTAWSLYINQTNGVDLRNLTNSQISLDLQQSIKRVSLQGKDQMVFRGPKLCFSIMNGKVIESYFSDIIRRLQEKNYLFKFLEGEGLFISWAREYEPPIFDLFPVPMRCGGHDFSKTWVIY